MQVNTDNYKPIAGVRGGGGGDIHFTVPGYSDECVDLSETYIFVKAKVLQDLSSSSSSSKQVLQSMFHQVIISLSRDDYKHKAYIQTLQDYNFAKLKSDDDDDEEFELIGRLRADICRHDKLLLKNVEIKVCFTPADDATTSLQIIDCTLYVRKVASPILSPHLQRVLDVDTTFTIR